MTTLRSLAVIAASLLVVQIISFSTAQVCDQPPKRGPCRMHIDRYYYNQKTKTCKKFIYGGCQGNGNNFLTKEACERSCQPVCDQPSDTGPCKMYKERYYYDQKTKTCKEFIYGGCQGNGNNFLTKEDCERSCQSVCDQPSETGLCKMHIDRYYYDKKTGTCKPFVYGGCGGNENNFATQKDCEALCKPAIRCGLPPVSGPCEAYIPLYYYDQETKTCKKFIYGGCKGNGNQFHTKEDCERTCKPDCGQPLDIGRCPGPIHRGFRLPHYYYDQKTGTCEPFIYGGCGGNKNKFDTQEDCEALCKPAHVCDQPLDASPCNTGPQTGTNRGPSCAITMIRRRALASHSSMAVVAETKTSLLLRKPEALCISDITCNPPPFFPSDEDDHGPFSLPWYYDQDTKTCQKFYSHFCKGDGGRFHTLEDCKRTCNSDSDQPLKPDPCKGYIKRYYYDKKTGTCKSFIYGGCGGNENNFATKEKCETLCKPKPVHGTSPMWHYYWMSSLDDEHMFS
ncbi:papilin-like [Rana temporaria]|uniref:papilin-like n=1 Tax=Rana temporaria TaxID=8407 RepID=UPI001AACB53C|nr:papilin-like [Rana temporaria]